MKVLAISGSARKIGNSEILAKEMLASLPEGVEKKFVRLADFNIEPCRACYACLPVGKKCVVQDDFETLLQEVRAADAIILASPVYFLGMHTKLKLLCDRLISVLNEAGEYAGRRCVVAVPYGVEGWQGYGIEATVSIARFLHLDVVGVLPVHAANPGEVVRPEILAAARKVAALLLPCVQAGNNIHCDSATHQSTNSEDIACGFCGSGLIRISKNGGIRCAICGAMGKVCGNADAQKSSIDFIWNTPEIFRYSAAGMTEHANRLESIKADFIARRREFAELRKSYRDD